MTLHFVFVYDTYMELQIKEKTKRLRFADQELAPPPATPLTTTTPPPTTPPVVSQRIKNPGMNPLSGRFKMF